MDPRCALPTGTSLTLGSVLGLFEEEVREHLGRLCPRPRPVRLPRLVDFDPQRHRFTVDRRYGSKRPDWTYPPAAAAAGSPGSGGTP